MQTTVVFGLSDPLNWHIIFRIKFWWLFFYLVIFPAPQKAATPIYLKKTLKFSRHLVCWKQVLKICCNPALSLAGGRPPLISPRGLLFLFLTKKPTSGKAIKMPIHFYNPFPPLQLSLGETFLISHTRWSIIHCQCQRCFVGTFPFQWAAILV